MSGSSCCVPMCLDRTSTRHRFPQYDRDLFRMWLEKINNKTLFALPFERIYKNSKVCRRHFEPTCFLNNQPRLIKYSVPTLFLPEKSYLPVDNKYRELKVYCRVCWEPKSPLSLESVEENNEDETTTTPPNREKHRDVMQQFFPDVQISDKLIDYRMCNECVGALQILKQFKTNFVKAERLLTEKVSEINSRPSEMLKPGPKKPIRQHDTYFTVDPVVAPLDSHQPVGWKMSQPFAPFEYAEVSDNYDAIEAQPTEETGEQQCDPCDPCQHDHCYSTVVAKVEEEEEAAAPPHAVIVEAEPVAPPAARKPTPPKEAYQCKACKQIYITKKLIDEHMAMHEPDADGEPCGFRVYPVRIKNGVHLHQCPTCAVVFTRFKLLQRHVHANHKETLRNAARKRREKPTADETETGDNIYLCAYCSKTFSKQHVLLKHEKTHNRKHRCDLCTKSFSRAALLERHVERHVEADTKEKKRSRSKKPHPCHVCGKVLTSPGALKDHLLLHTGELPHECAECGKRFRLRASLTLHEAMHKGEKNFMCQYCDRQFYTRAQLRIHERIHTGEKPIKCDHCDATFRTYREKLVHGRRKHNVGVKHFCKFCDKPCSSSSQLVAHTRVHSNERPYQCKVCSFTFKYRNNLIRHKVMHEAIKPFSCKHCHKTFTQKSSMRHHEIRHEPKTIMCEMCSKMFYDKWALQKHELSHHAETQPSQPVDPLPIDKEPFHCDRCGKTFLTHHRLMMHVHRVHEYPDQFKPLRSAIEPNDRQILYKCAYCPKAFAQRGLLNFHMKIHTGEHRRWPCKYCEHVSTSKLNNTRHERTHTGELPFKCPLCDRGFADAERLRYHEVVHTGARPYVCKFCDKTFTHPSSLHKHRKFAHVQEMIEEVDVKPSVIFL